MEREVDWCAGTPTTQQLLELARAGAATSAAWVNPHAAPPSPALSPTAEWWWPYPPRNAPLLHRIATLRSATRVVASGILPGSGCCG